MGTPRIPRTVWTELGRTIRRVIDDRLRNSGRRRSTPSPGARDRGDGVGRRGYPGDFDGVPRITYAPHPDGEPDPGEIVWAWVPYEESHSRGKDRPVLLIGRDGPWLLGLPLTSRNHDRDKAQEASQGRYWIDIGAGPWDSRGRPSEARLDRILRVDPARIRREGAVLGEGVFERVRTAVIEARRD